MTTTGTGETLMNDDTLQIKLYALKAKHYQEQVEFYSAHCSEYAKSLIEQSSVSTHEDLDPISIDPKWLVFWSGWNSSYVLHPTYAEAKREATKLVMETQREVRIFQLTDILAIQQPMKVEHLKVREESDDD